MGYSAATPIENMKARDEMLAFLHANMRPAYQINLRVKKEHDWTQDVLSDLYYDSGHIKIGFNFSISSFFCGDYGFAILRWIALRVGSKRCLKGYSEPVPYYRYDGCVSIPVLLRSVWEGRVPEGHKGVLVDEHGFMPTRKWWLPISHRRDGYVERWVMTNAPESDLANLRNDDRVTVSGDGPYRIESCEPSMVTFVADQLEALGHTCDFGYGPIVIGPGRKAQDDHNKPIWETEQEIIKQELIRLSDLWNQHNISKG